MKSKLKNAYMKTAETFAELSHAKRLHVGAIIVKDDRIISIGYNGMPAGWDNNCEVKNYLAMDAGGWIDPEEIKIMYPHQEFVAEVGEILRYKLVTRPEVLHAESNAIAKLARSNDSGEGADIFVTHAPCMECAKLIYQSGIKRVFYGEAYRSDDGIKFLKASGIEVEHLERNN